MEKQQETEEVQAKIQEILEKCKQGEFIFRGEKRKPKNILFVSAFAKLNSKEKQKNFHFE